MKKITTLILMIFTLVFTSACSCGKSDPTMQDYSDAFGELAEKIFVNENEPTVATLSYVDSKESEDRNYYSVGAFVIFLREAFKNENFDVLGKGVVYFTSTAKLIINEQRGEMPMDANLKIDYSEGKIKTDMYMEENNNSSHMIIDIEYDFKNKELKSFDLYFDNVYNGETIQVNHYKGVGDTISILEDVEDEDYTNAVSILNSRLNVISDGFANAKNIGDYSKEYTTAMVEQGNLVYGEGFITPAAE